MLSLNQKIVLVALRIIMEKGGGRINAETLPMSRHAAAKAYDVIADLGYVDSDGSKLYLTPDGFDAFEKIYDEWRAGLH